MTPKRPIISHLLFGAAAFWLPSVLLHAFGAESIWPLTILPIIGFLVAYRFALGRWKSRSQASVAFFMITGVWLFASTGMTINASFSGGGFANGFVNGILVIVLGLVPPYTLIMSAYDGIVLALFFVTSFAGVAHFIFEAEHWILPPETQSRLKRWYERHAA